MNFSNLSLFCILLICLSCISNPKEDDKEVETKEKNYVLVSDDDNILVEEFDSTVVDVNRYNSNNRIYTVGRVFKYDFKHITPEDEVKYFRINEDRKSWSFVLEPEIDSTTLKSVTIEVLDGNPMSEHLPDYNQTNLKYVLNEDIGYSTSGAIENEGNVWIHPPRDRYFKILELNPFPYIKAPYEIGTSWTWDLTIGDGWADERWKVWEGQIVNKYNYEITAKETLNTKIGKIECYIIESNANSRIGDTKLKAYFNSEYGFVELDYTNIDNSKTILELVDVD